MGAPDGSLSCKPQFDPTPQITSLDRKKGRKCALRPSPSTANTFADGAGTEATDQCIDSPPAGGARGTRQTPAGPPSRVQNRHGRLPASVEVAGSCRGRCRRVCCRPACAARLAPRRFSGALRAPDAEHAAVRPLDLTIRSCNAVGIDRQPGPGAVGRRKRGRSLAPRNRRHLLDRGGSTPDRQGLRPESHAFTGAAGSSSAHCLRRLGHRWQATVPWWRATVTMGVCDYYRDAVRQ